MGKQIATLTGGRQSALLGLGVYRPERVVTNDEICELIDSNDEWIQSRSGIRNRRFAAEDENVVTMSIAAGREAIAASGIAPEQIGCVIVATSTYLLLTPPAAAVVADALGTNGPGAFDLGGGCAGFCTALAVASDMVRGGSIDYALVVGVEKMSITTDPTDRSTRFIFGDGAGAVVVGKSDVAGIGPVEWGRTARRPTPSCRTWIGTNTSRRRAPPARTSRWPEPRYSAGPPSRWARWHCVRSRRPA